MHHEIDADLKPLTITLHFPQEHEGGLTSEYGFTCPHNKKEIVQSCDDCGAKMDSSFVQVGEESPHHFLNQLWRLTYDFQVGIRLGNKDHKCDPLRNPSCKAAHGKAP